MTNSMTKRPRFPSNLEIREGGDLGWRVWRDITLVVLAVLVYGGFIFWASHQ